jgi:transcriptional regulator with XRE-family HTH domain
MTDREIEKQLALFGSNVRAARERLGLAQDKLGLDRAAVSFLERAQRAPDLPTLLRLAEALRVEAADLLVGIGEGAEHVRAPRHSGEVGSEPAARFGANLRWAREERDMSQEKLALEANVDRAAISVFERGRRDPNLRTIFKLAWTLKLPPAVLVQGVQSNGGRP